MNNISGTSYLKKRSISGGDAYLGLPVLPLVYNCSQNTREFKEKPEQLKQQAKQAASVLKAILNRAAKFELTQVLAFQY